MGPKDYARSGFDRGHLRPSADRTRSVDDNSQTFLMTDMHPQRLELNQVRWGKLFRDLAVLGASSSTETLCSAYSPTGKSFYWGDH
jgi:DNA/RNA endonuclease G (NUC1)